jgi:hypothetical protein
MKKLMLIVTLWLTLDSCNLKSDDLDSFITENATAYNERIAQGNLTGEHWAQDPLAIVNELFQSDEFARKVTLDVDRKSSDEMIVTLTREGLEDDSLNGEKRTIEFEKRNGLWTIRNIQLRFKCRKNRGHTHYSGDFCS